MASDSDSQRVTSSEAPASFFNELGGNAILLTMLVVLLVAVPLLPPGDSDQHTRGVIARIAWSALIVAAILRTSGRRYFLWAALVIAVPSILSRWVEVAWLASAGPLVIALFFALIVAHIIADIFSQRQIRFDHILGGINVYLLLGVLFARLHVATEKFNGDSYAIGGLPIAAAAEQTGRHVEDLLQYFSFTTLSTLGYGDVQPVSQAARVLSITEAVIGQLFLAILIARLVSVYTSRRALTPGP